MCALLKCKQQVVLILSQDKFMAQEIYFAYPPPPHTLISSKPGTGSFACGMTNKLWEVEWLETQERQGPETGEGHCYQLGQLMLLTHPAVHYGYGKGFQCKPFLKPVPSSSLQRDLHVFRLLCFHLWPAQVIHNDTGCTHSIGFHKIYKHCPNSLCTRNTNLG